MRRDDDKLYKFKKGDFKRLRIQDIEDITYCSDLKHKEAYIAYSNPRGFIYQNKDKQNRLMRIDELHKFSDGTLTDEVILFYNGLEVPTRQILDSKGAIPTMTAANEKIAFQEMVEHSQKLHNGMSTMTRSTETSNGLSSIQAQLNNLGREIKKLKEKPTIKEGAIDDEPMAGIDKARWNDEIIDGLDEYPSYYDLDRKIHIDYAYNLNFSCMIGFQSLLSQLKTHGAGVSTKDANQKFLRSLPSFWSQVSLIMRTKPGVDTLNFDDLYNNLRVFESDVKGYTRSSSSLQNLAFVSSENTSSTNEWPKLDHEELEQVDEFDLEEMDLKWQVTMISTRLEKFYKKTGRKLHFDAKEPVGFDKSKVECIDWTGHAEDKTKDYALMAYNPSTSGSDTKMSAKDKSGLGYGSQIHDGVLSNKNVVFASVFDSRSSDVEDSPMTDRFVKVEGMHVVPPPMTGNYKTLKSNFRIDESKFTYVLAISLEIAISMKRMDKQIELTKQKGKSTGPWENRPVWNNVKRLNHQNKFVPTPVLTKAGKFLVYAARQSFTSQAALTSTARKVNTARPKVHENRPGKNVVVGGKWETAVKASTDTEFLVLSPDFKFPDANQVLLRVPRQHNMYSFNLANIVPSGSLDCLIAKATIDESTKWHRRVNLEGKGGSEEDQVKLPHDSPLSGGHTSDIAKGSNQEDGIKGRKNAKSRPTKDDSAEIDTELDEDMEYIDTKEAVNGGGKAQLILLGQMLVLLDKGKALLEEPEFVKKMTKSDFDAAQIVRDEEIARPLEVELQAGVERERQREEQASMDNIANLYDEVQARIDANHGLAGLYTKEQELSVDFVPIGSEEDERRIREINTKAEEESNDKDMEQKESIIAFLDLMEAQDGLKPF
nr:hypothetical protein [Tanacetum cinerariifolium]